VPFRIPKRYSLKKKVSNVYVLNLEHKDYEYPEYKISISFISSIVETMKAESKGANSAISRNKKVGNIDVKYVVLAYPKEVFHTYYFTKNDKSFSIVTDHELYNSDLDKIINA
jgi:hypothetical protein